MPKRDFPYPISDRIEPFDAFGSVSVPAGGEADLIVGGFEVPAQARGGAFVELFGHGINAPAWGTTVWAITVEGVGVRYYDDIQDQLGEFHDPRPVAPIRVEPGQTINVHVQNNDGAPHLFGARIRGFLDRG